MKNIKIILSLLLIATFSCSEDFEKVNTDPDKATEIPAHLLLGTLITATQNTIYNAQIGGDMGECWAQHWSKVQYNDEARYTPRRTGVIDVIWSTLYASVISDAKSMYDLAETEGNSNLQGAALVMQANAFQLLTELYGPVPFDEAVVEGVEQPAYNTSQEVFAGVIAMLTQADGLFSLNEGEITASSDLLYGGDVSKWKKLANALKFKALMRSGGASSELQALVGTMFTSNADSAQLAYLANSPDANPIFETIVFGNRSEYKISDVLVTVMAGDPRLPVYAGENADGNIVGKPAGYSDLPNDALGFTYSNISPLGDKYLDPLLPGVIMSYAQLQFLMAEAANEGKISGGIAAAKTYFDNGIVANFEFNGLSSGSSYTGGFSFANQTDARLKIATQVWIALFGQGFETWAEWRRTGVPALTPAVEGAISTIPTRLFYPTTQVSLNKDNYDTAKGMLNNGDNLNSKLFWTL